MKKLGFLFIIITAVQSIFLAAVIAAVGIFTSRKLDPGDKDDYRK